MKTKPIKLQIELDIDGEIEVVKRHVSHDGYQQDDPKWGRYWSDASRDIKNVDWYKKAGETVEKTNN